MNNLAQIKIIIPPESCPSCNSLLVLVKDQLFCRSNECPAQSTKKVEAFAKVLKIKGMGLKTAEKLQLVSPVDLYSFSEETLIDKLGEKIGSKLYSSIQASRSVAIETLIQAFSIPLVGKVASKKLAPFITSIDQITEETCKKASIGEKTTNNLLDWIENIWVDREYNILMNYISIISKAPVKTSNNGKTVVITGKLNNYKNRREATEYLESEGFIVKSSVNKTIDFLISEEGRDSSSTKKAESLNIPILSIVELVNENQTT